MTETRIPMAIHHQDKTQGVKPISMRQSITNGWQQATKTLTEMACERNVGGSSGIGKREPTAKIVDFSIDPAGFWLWTTIYVEKTASEGRRINAWFCCCCVCRSAFHIFWHNFNFTNDYLLLSILCHDCRLNVNSRPRSIKKDSIHFVLLFL